MINKAIINAVLNTATKEDKIKVLNELLNHISMIYDYNDMKAGHILEMLCDSTTIIKTMDVDINYIKNNLNLLIYNSDKYNIKDIEIAGVDNIDCVVKINYRYIEKINEDRSDISYQSSYNNINFIDNPDILKK